MKKIFLLLAISLLLPGVLLAEEAKKASSLETFPQKLSYAMGLDVGGYFKELGSDIQLDVLIRGITDAYTGGKIAMTKDEITSVQKEFGEKLQAKQAAQMKEMQEKNSAAGKAFLEENKKKKGVVVTKSGLQYEVVKKGTGPKPKADDQVKVDYAGTLIDGKEFDSSIKRGQPVTFGVSQVIPGWTEALQLMEVGSKYRLVIPAELAYGEKGAPPVIEPNSVLIFDVELHSIEKAEAAAPAAPVEKK